MEDTLQYHPYKDELQNVEMFHILDEEPEVAPEWGGQFVNAEILLPWDKMAKGHMVCSKHDADGNPRGRSNHNPILNTHLYEVEFSGEEMTELAANIIEESMYAQYDVNGNKNLLIEAFIVHRKNGSALSAEDQKIVITRQEILRKSTAG